MTSYEEWRVSGTPGLLPVKHAFLNEEDARDCLAVAARQASIMGPWTDGPHLHRRTVTVTEWEEAQ